MSERFYYLLIILLFTFAAAHSQVPVIQKIEPVTSFPKSRILITGSGFSSTPSQLQVWFDQVKGTVITSTNFSIEVEVPAQARLASVTVLNLTSKLSAQSKLKFMPVFSGEGFDPSKLTAPFSVASPNAIFDIISVDIDGDNKPDLIGSQNESDATDMTLLMNQSTLGNIAFTNTPLATLKLNAPTGHLAAGDLNGDGKPDIVASRSGTTSNTVFILINISSVGNPDFSTPVSLVLDIIQGVREVGITDLNGDGKPEIVVANTATNNIYIYKNESAGGSLVINPTPVKVTVTGAASTGSLELQDMDGDGMTDIVASGFQDQDIFILKNTSTSSAINFTNITKFTYAAKSFRDLSTADFNKDGKLDIVGTSIFSNQALVLMNESSNTSFVFKLPITLPTDTQPFGIDVCDLNGDNFPDIIIPNKGSNTLNAYLHNGDISAVGFTKVVVPTNKNNWFVRAGDLDGDAKPDLAFTSITGSTGPFSIDILRNKNCHKPQILNEGPLTLCPSQTIKLVTIPIPGVTWDWSNGFASISSDPFANVSVAATYTVTAKGENGACSVISAPLIIQSGAGSLPADPVITTNAPICAGTALTLSTPIVSGASYKWAGPNNFTSSLSNISIPSATIANAGIYSLTVKVGDCSSNTVTKRVDIVAAGSFSISSSVASNTICQSQSLTLTVNSETGYSYQWLKDNVSMSGKTTPSLIVTEGGSYKVKVSNTAFSCSQETSPVSVVVYTAPVASFTLDASGCIGTLINFSNISVTDTKVTSVTYLWEFGDNTTSTDEDPTHTYSTAQTYNPKLTIGYSGVSGCTSSVTKSITIATGTPPVITALNTELCNNGTEKSRLSVSGNFSSYKWSTGEETPNIDVSSPGDYTVDTVEPNGCKGFDTFTITEKTDCNTQNPLVFTPNGDSQNDFWILPGIENKQDCTMNIFDGRGRKVLERKGFPVGGWDGVSDEGKAVPDGTYYYVFSCPDQTPETGSVLIVR